jgi:hypothetical protein
MKNSVFLFDHSFKEKKVKNFRFPLDRARGRIISKYLCLLYLSGGACADLVLLNKIAKAETRFDIDSLFYLGYI